ncbi:MAG: hypothetical protein MJ252_08245 [archaeon]|nr:hypothetical protein [archaeon]
MSKKVIKADEDTRPIEYYNYIVEGQKIWRKTDQKLAEDEKGAPKKDDAMPYELKEVKGRDDKKRIVHFVEGTDVKYKHTIPFCNELTIDIPDMANVGAINEMDLLNNLVNRLNRDETFSNCGSTLIIFNPYKRIQGVYGEDMIKYYREQQDLNPPESRDENPKPHLYDLVLIAIREVKRSGSRSQALLVSGESGAGKTVATKNAMECVTKYFAKPGAKDDIPLEQKILNTNPILEAFGNAKTVRNENSSRFGKYVKLKLNPEATEIVGAEMTGYLLEKSRITDGNENERNYHVFYHLLACGDSNLLSQLHLDPDPKKYKFLNYGPNQVYTAKDIDDHEFFIEMDRCFNDNGFSPEEKLQVYKVVAAVLHFGNVTIKRKSDTEASFEPIEEYRYACELLGYDEDTLKEPLTRKYIAIEKKYGNVFTEEELKTFKNAVAKEMFNKTFFWIIEKLNLMLKEKTPAGRYIGLLDIFGFECFVHNSIEQLCINYTNECLQQLYIKDIFENDIEEFKKEGLGDKVNLLAATYKDNKDLLIMIKGFFEELNDVKKNDTIYENIKKFPTRVGKPGVYKDAKTCSFEVPPFKDNKFMVVHTAKKVTYETDNFVEKNADEIKVNVLLKIYESKSTIFKMMYANVIDEKLLDAKIAEDTDTETVSADRKRKRFLGTKFSMDMDKLTEELLACDHHYVRCIKPNELKSPGIFYYNFIFNQIEYLGILSSIQVRQNGFPIRRRYQDFFDAFKIILSISKKDIVDKQEWYKSKTDEIINKLVEGRGLGDISEKRLYGNTKVYMKQEFSVKLEQIKQEMLITKTNAGKKLRTAVLYLKMKKKIPKIEGSIKKLQDFFNGNKAKIRLQKKKDKIKIIQALYFTVYQQKYFTEVQNNYETVINIFEMIKARNTLSKSKNLMKFLSWRMQIYLANLKDNLRKKIKKVTIDICINEIVKKRIERHERGILWENTRKFFEMALVRTKYPKIVQTSKKTVSEYKYINIMQVFTAHMLLWKVQSRRKATKEIYIAATTQNLMRNIWCVIESTKIIQKYIGRLLNKKDALKQIDDFYFKKNKIGKGETKEKRKEIKKESNRTRWRRNRRRRI